MGVSRRATVRVGKGVAVALMLACSVALIAWAAGGKSAEAAVQPNSKIDAGIFLV